MFFRLRGASRGPNGIVRLPPATQIRGPVVSDRLPELLDCKALQLAEDTKAA
jgi:hypothetical protein